MRLVRAEVLKIARRRGLMIWSLILTVGSVAVTEAILLILHAANDPFIRITPETRARIATNPHITFLESEDGGHCSFMADPNGYDGRWAESRVVEFLKDLAS